MTLAGSGPSIYEPLREDISGGVVFSFSWARPNGMLGAHLGQRFNSFVQKELIFPQWASLLLSPWDKIPWQKPFKQGRKGLFWLQVPGSSLSPHPHPLGKSQEQACEKLDRAVEEWMLASAVPFLQLKTGRSTSTCSGQAFPSQPRESHQSPTKGTLRGSRSGQGDTTYQHIPLVLRSPVWTASVLSLQEPLRW